jgi:hypothetical protein
MANETAQPIALEPGEGRGAVLLLLDTFLRFREFRAWGVTFVRILRSPRKNMLAIADAGDEHAAIAYLKTSMFLYIAFALSHVLVGGDLRRQLVVPLAFAVNLVVGFWVFYVLARGAASVRRAPREYLEFSALMIGTTIPVVTLMFVPLLLTTPSPLYLLPGEVVIGYLFVGLVRAWKAYLGVSTARVLGCLVASGIAGGIVSMTILIVAGVWGGGAAGPS